MTGVVGLPPVIIKQPVADEILFKTGNWHRTLEVECEADGEPMPK